MLTRLTKGIIWMAALAGVVGIVFGAPGTTVAGQERVDVCHIDGTGTYSIITIADPAYDSHIAHGDIAVQTFFVDADGDGFGSTSLTVEACTTPEGFVENSDDCLDSDPAVNPDAVEIPGDGIDNDCNLDTPDDVDTCEAGTDVSQQSSGDACTAACDIFFEGRACVTENVTFALNPPPGIGVTCTCTCGC